MSLELTSSSVKKVATRVYHNLARVTEVACALPCHCTMEIWRNTQWCRLEGLEALPIAKQYCGRNELKMCKMEIWGPSLLLVPKTSCRQELHVFCNGPVTFLGVKISGF